MTFKKSCFFHNRSNSKIFSPFVTSLKNVNRIRTKKRFIIQNDINCWKSYFSSTLMTMDNKPRKTDYFFFHH